MEKIQVALRVRPLNSREQSKKEENIWQIVNNVSVTNKTTKSLQVSRQNNELPKVSFTYDYCFQPKHDNQCVYQTVVKSVVLSSLSGYNGTIFMYGQTGSGKTYTMMGYNDKTEDAIKDGGGALYSRALSLEQGLSSNTGVLIQSLKDIFSSIDHDQDKTYFLKCSYVEIYNDQIYDLLAPPESLAETLPVAEDTIRKEFYVRGVTQESVSSIEEILEKLQRGELNRHYAATAMNHSSSRSHTIFRFYVQAVTNAFIRKYRRKQAVLGVANINNTFLEGFRDGADNPPPEIDMTMDSQLDAGIGNQGEEGGGSGTMVTESYLNFVDLAGSEKVSNHQGIPGELGSSGVGLLNTIGGSKKAESKDRVNEGKHINKSLFFLTQVISLMSEGKGISTGHIPFRNSPLTKILRSSLGGNSRTLIVLCVTPAESQYEQTLSTLRFGANAKKIENRVCANIVTNDDNEAVRIMISDYEGRLRHAEAQRKDDKALINKFKLVLAQLATQKSCLLRKLKIAQKNEKQSRIKQELNSVFSVDKDTPLKHSSFMEKTRQLIEEADTAAMNSQMKVLFEEANTDKAIIKGLQKEYELTNARFKGTYAKLIEWVIFYRGNLEEMSKHCGHLTKKTEILSEQLKKMMGELRELRKFTDDEYLELLSDEELHKVECRALKLVDLVKMELVMRAVKKKMNIPKKEVIQISNAKSVKMKEEPAKMNSSVQTGSIENTKGQREQMIESSEEALRSSLVFEKIQEIKMNVAKSEKDFGQFLQSEECDFSKMTIRPEKELISEFSLELQQIESKWLLMQKEREGKIAQIIRSYSETIQDRLNHFEKKISEIGSQYSQEADDNNNEVLEEELKQEVLSALGIDNQDYIDDEALINFSSLNLLNQFNSCTKGREKTNEENESEGSSLKKGKEDIEKDQSLFKKKMIKPVDFDIGDESPLIEKGAAVNQSDSEVESSPEKPLRVNNDEEEVIEPRAWDGEDLGTNKREEEEEKIRSKQFLREWQENFSKEEGGLLYSEEKDLGSKKNSEKMGFSDTEEEEYMQSLKQKPIEIPSRSLLFKGTSELNQVFVEKVEEKEENRPNREKPRPKEEKKETRRAENDSTSLVKRQEKPVKKAGVAGNSKEVVKASGKGAQKGIESDPAKNTEVKKHIKVQELIGNKNAPKKPKNKQSGDHQSIEQSSLGGSNESTSLGPTSSAQASLKPGEVNQAAKLSKQRDTSVNNRGSHTSQASSVSGVPASSVKGGAPPGNFSTQEGIERVKTVGADEGPLKGKGNVWEFKITRPKETKEQPLEEKKEQRNEGRSSRVDGGRSKSPISKMSQSKSKEPVLVSKAPPNQQEVNVNELKQQMFEEPEGDFEETEENFLAEERKAEEIESYAKKKLQEVERINEILAKSRQKAHGHGSTSSFVKGSFVSSDPDVNQGLSASESQEKVSASPLLHPPKDFSDNEGCGSFISSQESAAGKKNRKTKEDRKKK